MNAKEIIEHARRLREVRGNDAIADAAQKATAFERDGDATQAQTWRRIETALLEMRGPRAS